MFNCIAYYLLVQLGTVCGNKLCLFEVSRLFESCGYHGLNTSKSIQSIIEHTFTLIMFTACANLSDLLTTFHSLCISNAISTHPNDTGCTMVSCFVVIVVVVLPLTTYVCNWCQHVLSWLHLHTSLISCTVLQVLQAYKLYTNRVG
jgi:hypothetical protein